MIKNGKHFFKSEIGWALGHVWGEPINHAKIRVVIMWCFFCEQKQCELATASMATRAMRCKLTKHNAGFTLKKSTASVPFTWRIPFPGWDLSKFSNLRWSRKHHTAAFSHTTKSKTKITGEFASGRFLILWYNVQTDMLCVERNALACVLTNINQLVPTHWRVVAVVWAFYISTLFKYCLHDI